MNTPKSTQGKRSLDQKVILVVDDTPDNLAVAKTVLMFHGATVHTATNGAEALEILRQITPNLILLDIRMPTMDGWEMFHSARNTPHLQNIPIIAVTAYAMSSDREEILRAGFDSYISKPFDITHLVDVITEVITRSAQQRT